MPLERAAGGLRVFFYVQHLLGIGHLHRAARIAKALADDGCEVRLVLGGPPTPSLDVGGATILQLPPVKAGPDGFAKLVHPDGRAFDTSDAEGRTRLLLRTFDDHAPDVLLIEAFPFGRRQMRFELLPLLERARAGRPAPLIASSVRDILQESRRPERVAETVDLVQRAFDLVLVHGDPAFAPFEASFPAADRLADKLVYTGLVAPPRPAPAQGVSEGLGAVVSVGGGAVGKALLGAALAARPLTRIADRPWLLLTGPNGPASLSDLVVSSELRIGEGLPSPVGGEGGSRGTRETDEGSAPLRRVLHDPSSAPAGHLLPQGGKGGHGGLGNHENVPRRTGVVVERFVPDLAQVLSRAEVSVSQAGYNTVADILAARTRAVLVPFARDGETEQTARATRLRDRGYATVLPEGELSPARLAAAIDAALAQPSPSGALDLDGARATGRILQAAFRGLRNGRAGAGSGRGTPARAEHD